MSLGRGIFHSKIDQLLLELKQKKQCRYTQPEEIDVLLFSLFQLSSDPKYLKSISPAFFHYSNSEFAGLTDLKKWQLFRVYVVQKNPLHAFRVIANIKSFELIDALILDRFFTNLETETAKDFSLLKNKLLLIDAIRKGLGKNKDSAAIILMLSEHERNITDLKSKISMLSRHYIQSLIDLVRKSEVYVDSHFKMYAKHLLMNSLLFVTNKKNSYQLFWEYVADAEQCLTNVNNKINQNEAGNHDAYFDFFFDLHVLFEKARSFPSPKLQQCVTQFQKQYDGLYQLLIFIMSGSVECDRSMIQVCKTSVEEKNYHSTMKEEIVTPQNNEFEMRDFSKVVKRLN